MAGLWEPVDGPDGEVWELSADGLWLRIDGEMFGLADVETVPGGVVEAWRGPVPPPPGGWA